MAYLLENLKQRLTGSSIRLLQLIIIEPNQNGHIRDWPGTAVLRPVIGEGTGWKLPMQGIVFLQSGGRHES